MEIMKVNTNKTITKVNTKNIITKVHLRKNWSG